MSYRTYTSYSGDPRWLNAKFSSRCSCGETIHKGERILYWPKGKTAQCQSCGEPAWRQFESEAADEYAYSTV